MLKSRLYIHIGTQKTGSTAIQSILSQNRKELNEEGIVYLGRYMSFAKHIAYVEKADQKIIDQTCRDMAQRIKKYGNGKNLSFILSNETFCGDKLTGYRNAGRVASILKDITQSLEIDTKIIVYLRRQDKFFESLYTQRIHNGASYTFEEFYNKFDNKAFHWDDLLNKYACKFGEKNLIVRRYDKFYLPKKDSLIQNFGQIVNSEFLSSYTDSKIKNPGFSRDTLEISRLTSPYLNKGDSKKLRILLKSVSSKEPFKNYSFFNPPSRKEFMKRFEESNAIVAKKYFNDSSASLFPAPEKDPNYEPYPGLTPEKIVINLSKAIAIINRKTWTLEKEVEHLKAQNKNPFKKKVRRIIGFLLSPFPRLKSRLKKWTEDNSL